MSYKYKRWFFYQRDIFISKLITLLDQSFLDVNYLDLYLQNIFLAYWWINFWKTITVDYIHEID